MQGHLTGKGWVGCVGSLHVMSFLPSYWAVKPVNQPWIFTGRTDAKAEAPILWPSDVKSWLTGKDPDAGKNWSQEKKEMTEDEIVIWHDGQDFEQARGVGDGQGSLMCCSPWGHKESDTTEWLNCLSLKDIRQQKRSPQKRPQKL